jgi:hypothetical protein
MTAGEPGTSGLVLAADLAAWTGERSAPWAAPVTVHESRRQANRKTSSREDTSEVHRSMCRMALA